jgi:hypothetical protein
LDTRCFPTDDRSRLARRQGRVDGHLEVSEVPQLLGRLPGCRVVAIESSRTEFVDDVRENTERRAPPPTHGSMLEGATLAKHRPARLAARDRDRSSRNASEPAPAPQRTVERGPERRDVLGIGTLCEDGERADGANASRAEKPRGAVMP